MPENAQTHQIVVIPCLSDNYAVLIHNPDNGQTALVDAPEAAPIQAELDARGWTLTDILITHHHDDHIDGVAALRSGARVVGAAADAHRLPALDLAVSDGDTIEVCGVITEVLDVSGHTLGHIAYHMPEVSAAFTADSLMAMGCGRLFEGTPDQMWTSLQKLRALPQDTMIYSGHEYTASNAKFALTIEPDNAALISRVRQITADRAVGTPTVPSKLSDEIATNPFLRADNPELQKAVNMAGANANDVFAYVRKAKDTF